MDMLPSEGRRTYGLDISKDDCRFTVATNANSEMDDQFRNDPSIKICLARPANGFRKRRGSSRLVAADRSRLHHHERLQPVWSRSRPSSRPLSFGNDKETSS
jgi:hypothetical protein